jgi:hypothetical protein
LPGARAERILAGMIQVFGPGSTIFIFGIPMIAPLPPPDIGVAPGDVGTLNQAGGVPTIVGVVGPVGIPKIVGN